MAFNLNDLLNNTSKSKDEEKENIDLNFNIRNIDIDHIEPATENFYRVEDIENIKQSIELLGIEQNLIVERIDKEKYKLIAGHRRYFASKVLVEEGKEKFRILPCKVKSKSEDNSLFNKLTMIMTNSTSRELNDWEKMQQSLEIEEVISQIKKENKMKGRTRDILSEILNISASQLARYKAIDNNLIEELKEEFKKSNINYSVAYKSSQLTEEYQRKAYLKLQEDGSISINDINVLKEREEYIKPLEGQISIEDSISEVNEKVIEENILENNEKDKLEDEEENKNVEETEEEVKEKNIKEEAESEVSKEIVKLEEIKSEEVCTFCRANNNSTLTTEDERIVMFFDSTIRKVGVTNIETGEVSYIKLEYCPCCSRKIY